MSSPRLHVVQAGARKPGPVDAKRWFTALMAASDLPPWVRVVGGYIGGLYNPKRGFAYPARSQIAEETGIDQRHVVRAVKMLEESGWLSVTRGTGRGHSNEYHINLERVAGTPPFKNRKGGKTEQERVAKEPLKGGSQRHPNYEDSNGREDSNWSPRVGRASAYSAPLAQPGTQEATQRGDPPDQEKDEPPAQLEPAPDARADGGLALSSPPPALSGQVQDQDAMIRDIVEARFDWWCVYRDNTTLGPAYDSKYQTPDEVCRAWCKAIDHATAICGSKELAVELYRVLQGRHRHRDDLLAKAASSKNPPKYVATGLRREKSRQAKLDAKEIEDEDVMVLQEDWHTRNATEGKRAAEQAQAAEQAARDYIGQFRRNYPALEHDVDYVLTKISVTFLADSLRITESPEGKLASIALHHRAIEQIRRDANGGEKR